MQLYIYLLVLCRLGANFVTRKLLVLNRRSGERAYLATWNQKQFVLNELLDLHRNPLI